MPITLTLPAGVLSESAERQAFAELTQALLQAAGLAGNRFMTPNVVGTINTLPARHIFSGGQPTLGAFVELKLPGIALADAESKAGFTRAAAEIVERASGGRIPKGRVWTNIVYAADGSWGIGGRAYSNAELGSAAAAGGSR